MKIELTEDEVRSLGKPEGRNVTDKPEGG